ncbi:hypothetical protein PQR34_43800 [Paraburkholderia sediminicola]|uniref:hypothetical protein n=1 Tax=Paraburkholderia sediminicola TaxID=458836 RepID=UPI0038B8ACA0
MDDRRQHTLWWDEILRQSAATSQSREIAMQPAVHLSTWKFLRGIYRNWYSHRPDLTLNDWLSDMRRAHAALLGEDIEIDRVLAQSIMVLEYAIIDRCGRLPAEITS